jgi:CDP-diacylglycerol--glycerol-3-phosphate 3-phosphatidyltransferase
MSSFGAFLDSTLDRLSEAAIFVGIVFFYAAGASPYEALLAGVAMTFSLLTSYARARAEGLGIECQVGLLERAGRVVILSVFSMLGLLTAGLGLVAAGAPGDEVYLVVRAQLFGSEAAEIAARQQESWDAWFAGHALTAS